nr:putative ribonuclease H-like domain-containing protein [Tanacetum cinerariifolium]GEZ02098.1 putative ribonuclease H-like domain-containing protein [Tanacetum cinerariifolium]
LFKTLCLLNYALMIRHDYDITSSLRRGALHCQGDKIKKNTDFKTCEKPVSQVEQIFLEELEKLKRQENEANDAAESPMKEATHDIQNANTSSINLLNTVSTPLSVAGPSRAFNDDELSYPNDPLMPHLEDIYASPTEGIFTNSSYNDEGVLTDFNNLETTMNKQQRNNHKDFQHCLFAYFLSQIEPKKISQALENESWVDAMQEELLQFQIQKVWILVDFPFGKKAIGTKWVYRNKKDERGVVVRNKARLVAQEHRQEERIDYDEVFAPVAKIEAIRIFLDFASYMGFIVYQMDVKNAFLYGTIDEKVFVAQPPGFVDPKFPNKVYKVVKALYGLHQAPRALYATLSTFLEQSRYRRGAFDKTLFIKQDKKDIMLNRFQMSSMGELTFFLGLPVKQKEDGIFISQDKYVVKILKKFNFLSMKTASTPIETQKPLVKDKEAADVDVYLYRRLISWKCKKQNTVATSTTEAEYVAAAHCCGQVLWIHN